MSSQDWVALAAVWVALVTTGTFLLCVFTLPHHLIMHPTWRRARREYQRQRAQDVLRERERRGDDAHDAQAPFRAGDDDPS